MKNTITDPAALRAYLEATEPRKHWDAEPAEEVTTAPEAPEATETPTETENNAPRIAFCYSSRRPPAVYRLAVDWHNAHHDWNCDGYPYTERVARFDLDDPTAIADIWTLPSDLPPRVVWFTFWEYREFIADGIIAEVEG